MKYLILALIGALLVAGCAGQTAGTGTQYTVADTSTVDTVLSSVDTDTSDLAQPDVDLDATSFG